MTNLSSLRRGRWFNSTILKTSFSIIIFFSNTRLQQSFAHNQHLRSSSSSQQQHENNQESIDALESYHRSLQISKPADRLPRPRPPQNFDVEPVMHTFYQRIDPKVHKKYGGMTDKSDSDLLLTWEAAWKAAGWKVRILTLEDAKSHPNYKRFDQLLDLDKMPFGYYDKLCFIRWLAMAAVGGGFMADYDTFPIRSFSKMKSMPRNGKLTVYDTVRQGGVPSVVSGSGDEFDRIAHSLLYNALQVGVREEFWSDMLALMDVYQKDKDVYLLFDQVLKGNVALEGVKKGLKSMRECKSVVGGNFAVHFSHFSITTSVSRGFLSKEKGAADRSQIADDFLKEWAKSCPELLTQKITIGG